MKSDVVLEKGPDALEDLGWEPEDVAGRPSRDYRVVVSGRPNHLVAVLE